MYHLYYGPGTAAMGVHAALEEIGEPFEIHPVDISQPRTPEYLRVNPHGKVPTLVVGDDATDPTHALYQCAAILLYLADKHPEAKLAPTPGSFARGLCDQHLFLMAEALQPAYMMHFYSERFTADPEQAPGVAAKGAELVDGIWKHLDGVVGAGPWLLGADFSVCDIYMHMLSLWHQPHHTPLTEYPNVSAALARIGARPAVRRMYERAYPG